ncbi:MAG: hypothetical protein K9M45_11955, partial [Kiritimatiellales bacterium]|nr:hypothetical protein [Kiritimatiellales bacterium]
SFELPVDELLKSKWKNESNGKPFAFKADGTVLLDKGRKAQWSGHDGKYEFTWPSGKKGTLIATDKHTLVIKEKNTTILKRVVE